jgi:hypothetical protein
MNRFFGILGGALLALLILVPVAAAADPTDRDEHLILSNRGDVTLGAGQHADLLIVIDGTATIEGDAGSVVVINGTADFIGSSTAGVVAVRSHVTFDDGSAATGEIVTFDSVVDAAPGASIQASTTDLATDLAGAAALAGAALFFVSVAFAISAIAAGLALAGLAGKQVREAGAAISREPIAALVAGLAGLVAIVIVGTLAIVTVVGLPLGLGILILVLPAMLVAGYLVAGIWVGDMILARTSPGVVRDRPYLAALIGLAVLGVLGIVPVVGSVIGGIVTLIGFGAVALLMWRTLRRPGAGERVVAPAAVASSVA